MIAARETIGSVKKSRTGIKKVVRMKSRMPGKVASSGALRPEQPVALTIASTLCLNASAGLDSRIATASTPLIATRMAAMMKIQCLQRQSAPLISSGRHGILTIQATTLLRRRQRQVPEPCQGSLRLQMHRRPISGVLNSTYSRHSQWPRR